MSNDTINKRKITEENINKMLSIEMPATLFKAYFTFHKKAAFDSYYPDSKQELLTLLRCSARQVSLIVIGLQSYGLIIRDKYFGKDGKQKIILQLIHPEDAFKNKETKDE